MIPIETIPAFFDPTPYDRCENAIEVKITIFLRKTPRAFTFCAILRTDSENVLNGVNFCLSLRKRSQNTIEIKIKKNDNEA